MLIVDAVLLLWFISCLLLFIIFSLCREKRPGDIALWSLAESIIARNVKTWSLVELNIAHKMEKWSVAEFHIAHGMEKCPVTPYSTWQGKDASVQRTLETPLAYWSYATINHIYLIHQSPHGGCCG